MGPPGKSLRRSSLTLLEVLVTMALIALVGSWGFNHLPQMLAVQTLQRDADRIQRKLMVIRHCAIAHGRPTELELAQHDSRWHGTVDGTKNFSLGNLQIYADGHRCDYIKFRATEDGELYPALRLELRNKHANKIIEIH